MKNNFFKLSIIGSTLSFFLFILSLTTAAGAQTMSNESYKIVGGALNSFSGVATGGEKKINFTSGNAANVYSGVNYEVRIGFEYLESGNPFAFAISSGAISFGDLKPGEPIIRTNNLTVSPSSAPGYQVTGSEDHELKVLPDGTIIQDTTCDNGSCTQTTAGPWASPLTYGFGYRCDNLSGTDCPAGFSQSNNYKQFANVSKRETAEIVMSGSKVKNIRKAQISYKVNISAIKPAGTYQNTIMYIATPTL